MPDPRDACVAIVGMGAVFPGAGDLAEFWRNIVGGVDAISEAPPGRWDPSYYDAVAQPGAGAADRFYCRRGGFVDDLVDFDPTRFGMMPVAVDGAEPDQLVALAVAAAALDDAGGEARLPDRRRVGIILGRGGYLTPGVARLDQRVRTAHQLVASLRELVPGLDDAQLDAVLRAFQDRLGPERPESSIGLVPNLAASRVANRLDLQGPAYTVDAACASSLLAVDQAVRELTSGRCDTVVAGGVHHCHDVTLWSVFTQLGALSPSQRIRPFDRQADGILIGEGTGMVVLKRLADAERDGDRIYAVIRGTGVASDGRASSLMAPRPDGQVLAIEQAWRAAGLDPTEPDAIGLLEAHGTATAAGDTTELTSLTRVFGPRHHASPDIGLGSVKSMIGHAMPAAGVAGLIKAALAVHHGVLPPTLHCDDPHPALTGARFAPVTAAGAWPTCSTPRRAGVNAFGFGGINAHVVLEQAPDGVVSMPRRRAAGAESGRAASAAPGAAAAAERVLLLAGPNPEDLARQLDADDASLLARDDATRPPDSGPCRLAIVAPNARRIALARRILAQGQPWRGRNDVWFTTVPLLGPDGPGGTGGGKLAFVFPGLEQGFEPRVDDVADHFGLPRPDLGGSDGLGQHGLGVITVGRLLDAALRELGLEPDLVAGHSVGEWSAMIAASMYPRAAVDAFISDFDTASVEVPGLVFAALGCGADEAAKAIAGLDRIVVSHDNCPHQSIICGDEESVATALERLKHRSVPGQLLPFRSGFHAPMLEPYIGPIRENLGRMPLQPPTVPVWSATAVAPYPDAPEDIRALAVRHLLEPVRFRALVRRLHDDGVRVFVQVGTGSVSGFVDDTLDGADYLAISANSPKRSGLDQLRRIAAALWVEGLAPRMDRLPTPSPLSVGILRFAGGAEPSKVRHAGNGGGVRLNLGAPLVHFNGTAPQLRLASAPEIRAANGHPILVEFDAALREAAAAAHDVIGSWQGPDAAPHAAAANPAAASPAATSPAAASPAAAKPAARRITTTRVLSLETMPFLVDHCFYRQRDGWADASDRYPVVPMTTLLELMREVAGELAPGRLVVGVRGVRALRWLAVAPPVTATVTAELDTDGNVSVSVDGYTRGTVLFADNYPAAPDLPDAPLTRERPPEINAERLYADRWMFHGPAFRGVSTLGPIGDDGIKGVLCAPAAPGALLDNAGQLMGLWIMLTTTHDRLAFPGAIERLSFYGPDPGTGEPVRCAVRVRSVADTEVAADLELRTEDGRLWAVIEGWKDRRFGTDEVTWPVFTNPETNTIADEQTGGWFAVHERWRDSATRELIMRRYLTAGERAEYEARNPRAQRGWLLGRIAVKDAVRRWLWSQGGGPVFPAEIQVGNDELGRPWVRGPFDHPLSVSLSHTGALAVAIVGPGATSGIDVEPLADRPGVEETALTPGERGLLDELTAARRDDRKLWLLRFWTAKEAAGKAEGTGLAGRPRDLVVRQVSGERLLVEVHDRSGAPVRAHWISTRVAAFPASTGQAPHGPAVNGGIANTAPHVVAWNGGDRRDDT